LNHLIIDSTSTSTTSFVFDFFQETASEHGIRKFLMKMLTGSRGSEKSIHSIHDCAAYRRFNKSSMPSGRPLMFM